MPFFPPGDDPGSSFPSLLQRVGLTPFASSVPEGEVMLPHATTCVAVLSRSTGRRCFQRLSDEQVAGLLA